MKDCLEYYYSLIGINFLDSNNLIFKCNEVLYLFYPLDVEVYDIEELSFINRELHNKMINTGKIIYNNFGVYYSVYNNKKYVLVAFDFSIDRVDLLLIDEFQKKTVVSSGIKSSLVRDKWSVLWSSKTEFIEEFFEKNKAYQKKIPYYELYVSLSENAIYYFNKLELNYDVNNYYVICHKCLKNSLDFYNPLNFVVDYPVRDIAEYIKECFWSGGDAFFELQNFLKTAHYSSFMYNLLFARLLFPSQFFYFVLNCDFDQNNDDLIEKYYFKYQDYLELLKKAYNEISLYAKLFEIEWIRN